MDWYFFQFLLPCIDRNNSPPAFPFPVCSLFAGSPTVTGTVTGRLKRFATMAADHRKGTGEGNAFSGHVSPPLVIVLCPFPGKGAGTSGESAL